MTVPIASAPPAPLRAINRPASTVLAGLLSLLLAACGGGEGGDSSRPEVTPPQELVGGGADPDTVTLDTPAPVILPQGAGSLLRLDTNQLQVTRSAAILFNAGIRPGDYDPFNDEVVADGRDLLVALDYGTGTARELVRREPGNFIPLNVFTPGERLCVSRFSGSLSTFLTEIPLDGGPPISQTEILPVVESCFAVVGEDFYFVSLGEYYVARDFASVGVVGQGERLAGGIPCGPSVDVVEVAGTLVAIESPSMMAPDLEVLAVRLEETAPAGRFFWNVLVVIDAATGQADLVRFGATLSRHEAAQHGLNAGGAYPG